MNRRAHHRRSSGSIGEERRQASAPAFAGVARSGTPTELGTLLRLADGGTRRRLTDDLQAQVGNARVAALVGNGTRIHGLPAHVRAGFASVILAEAMSDIGALFGIEAETEVETDEGATAVPTTSGTSIVVNDTTFNVAGEFPTMAANIAARTEAASVTSQVSDIYLEPIPGPVKLANITVTETRSMPNWVDRGDPKPEQVTEWNRFRGALATHEQTHVDIDTKAFTDIHKKCIGVSEEKANARIDKAIADADLANAEFDTNTDHGRNAGTKIDTNVGAGTIKVP